MKGKIVHLNSGEKAVVTNGEILSTTLGSCVAFCVYDSRKHIAGMVHFLLPDAEAAHRSSSVANNPLNFGSQGIVSLLREMKQLGCTQKDLLVSIVGGCLACNGQLDALGEVARQNIECGDTLAKRFGLRIASRKVGGTGRMAVRFDSADGSVYVSVSVTDAVAVERADKSDLPERIQTKQARPISVLIVDDSPAMQKILKATLTRYPELSVVGVASSAKEAETLRKKTTPDVMTLDIHMPEKDGVTYLSELMRTSPLPVIMVSDLSNKEAGPVMKALEMGAFDYVKKPALAEIEEMGLKLRDLIVAANQSFSRRGRKRSLRPTINRNVRVSKGQRQCDLLCIGASTGGTEALREMFRSFPGRTPPIVVVQHMPAAFTGAFAASLNRISKVETKEAQNGDILEANNAYIAPGGFQMKIVEDKEKRLRVVLSGDPPVNRFKPSVDFLFLSVAKLGICRRTSSALLTGMGDDGARGLLALRQAGAFTVAQSEESCVVFGMPKAAIARNAAIEIADLEDIVDLLCQKERQHVA